MVLAPINHISLDDRGVAYVTGTRIKVRHIVAEKNAWGLTHEQIQEGHENLSLAQIHAALAYYYDHKSEIDAEIAESKREVEQMRAESPNPIRREQFGESRRLPG